MSAWPGRRGRWAGLKRRGAIRVDPNDTRCPMHRLLKDCNNAASGMIEVDYDQQWRTLFKAQRLGYVDDQQRLTDAGRAWLADREEVK